MPDWGALDVTIEELGGAEAFAHAVSPPPTRPTTATSPRPGLQRAKLVFDVLATLAAAPAVLPLVAILAVMIKFGSEGPVFYAHERIGRGGRRFRAWKFRTMVRGGEQVLRDHLAANPEARAEWGRNHKLRRDPRVTGIGRVLRITSLDELPQLWNVLRGEMSLVGPRPIVDEEVSKYGALLGVYTRVRPGITGLWQVSGRNNTTYEERVAFDCLYVRNWSPWLDVRILVRTVGVVFRGKGAY